MNFRFHGDFRTMNIRTLSLAKGGQKYLFRYGSGSEDEIMDEIMRLADDTRNNLDWLDAATLGFQVAQHAAVDCLSAADPVDESPEE